MKQWIRTVCVGGVLALALFGPATAGTVEDAEAAYVRGDYATVMNYWRPLAEQGNAFGQVGLGMMYRDGRGVRQDDVRAFVLFRKAAEQGNALGENDLGVMYANGRGVPRDDAKAIVWWRKAAEQGYADAQGKLGVMYALGRSVPQDYVLAYMWSNLAAAGMEDAARLKMVVTIRDQVAAKMTPEQIAEAQKMTREWKPTR